MLQFFTLLASLLVNQQMQCNGQPSAPSSLQVLGCFSTSVSISVNTTDHSLDTVLPVGGDSAVHCVQECHKLHHRYAGIVAGKLCRCGNTFSGQSSDNCTVTCVQDSTNFCGGEQAISVYETGGMVPGPPLQLKLLESSSSGLHISWIPPTNDGSEEVLEYQVIATPLASRSGLDLPITRTWDFGKEATSAWLYGVNPATHYSIEVRAANKDGLGEPSITEGWTEIAHPPIPLQPEMLSRTPETITVKVHPVNPTNGPITAYQIIVVDETVGAIMNPSALTDYHNASRQSLPYYITAQFTADEFNTVFTVGDKGTYGRYYNAPLTTNRDYHILLGAVSQLNKTLTSYSPSDHGQHTSSQLDDDTSLIQRELSPIQQHEFPNSGQYNHLLLSDANKCVKVTIEPITLPVHISPPQL